jgi:hypothetical protein
VKPGVQVWGGRLSENDAMDGFAIEITGMSNERGGRFGVKSPSRREGGAVTVGGAVAEGGELMAALAASAREWVGVGEAAERRHSPKVLKSKSEHLIA